MLGKYGGSHVDGAGWYMADSIGQRSDQIRHSNSTRGVSYRHYHGPAKSDALVLQLRLNSASGRRRDKSQRRAFTVGPLIIAVLARAMIA